MKKHGIALSLFALIAVSGLSQMSEKDQAKFRSMADRIIRVK
jgi:hypothetical protein